MLERKNALKFGVLVIAIAVLFVSMGSAAPGDDPVLGNETDEKPVIQSPSELSDTDDETLRTGNARGGDSESGFGGQVQNKREYTEEKRSKSDTNLIGDSMGEDRSSGGDVGTQSSLGSETNDQDDYNIGSAVCSCEAKERKSQDVLGSSINGHTHFELDIADGYYIVDGHSEGAWYGSDPYNAEQASIGSTITVNGIEPTISIPVGASFSKSSSNVGSYSGSWQDTWQTEHQYWGLEGDAIGGVTSIEQSDSFTFRLDGTDYTIYTHIKK